MATSSKIQATADEYTVFVIENLVGVYGNTKSEVVTSLLRFWMKDNADFLGDHDLSIHDWKSSKLVEE